MKLFDMSLEELYDAKERIMLEIQYRPGSGNRWEEIKDITDRIKEIENELNNNQHGQGQKEETDKMGLRGIRTDDG